MNNLIPKDRGEAKLIINIAQDYAEETILIEEGTHTTKKIMIAKKFNSFWNFIPLLHKSIAIILKPLIACDKTANIKKISAILK